MSKGPIKNVAASVHQRLLNVARQRNRRFNDLLQYYALERWLYRLSRSQHRDRFILKGALLLVVWKVPATRPTRDIDLLGRLNNDPESIRNVIAEVCNVPVEDDGLVFDPASVTTERITEDAGYEGIRCKFQGRLGNARIAMQIDIGFGDVMTPGPTEISYPAILKLPAAQLLGYNRETAIAEKFETMVKLGELNSRMRDFFDIWLLAGSFDFDAASVAAAIRATFTQRQTPIEAAPVCFSEPFAHDRVKQAQWKAFVRRGLLANVPTEFADVVERIRAFLQPIATVLASDEAFGEHWPPGGPWQ